MSKLFFCCIWMISAAGCNLPAAVQPVATSTVVLTLPASATILPTFTPPQQVLTPDKNSFQGSVLLQSGACCIGGVVGTEAKLRKDFTAESPFSPVVEMRRKEGGFCFSEAEMANAAWEPFTASVVEPFVISAINWVGHYLSVQYRDGLGNLSPVFCDDISVEGMPAPPTPG